MLIHICNLKAKAWIIKVTETRGVGYAYYSCELSGTEFRYQKVTVTEQIDPISASIWTRCGILREFGVGATCLTLHINQVHQSRWTQHNIK